MNTAVVTQKELFRKQSKDMLAKLLATEDIRVVHKASASTASFDVKNRVLILPVWQGISEDLHDMLTVHEVGHSLDTPMDEWMAARETIAQAVFGSASAYSKKLVHGYTNVIEDVRVDKRQKRRYPGSVRNYHAGFKELWARDFFNVKKKPLDAMSFIDRANMYYKGGTMLGIKFNAQEKEFLTKMALTETFQDVVDLTTEVMVFCKAEQAKQLKQKFENDLKFGEEETDEDEDENYEDDEYVSDDDSDFEENEFEDGEGDEDDAKVRSLTKDNEGEKGDKQDKPVKDEGNATGEADGGKKSAEDSKDGKGKGAGEGEKESDKTADAPSDVKKEQEKEKEQETGFVDDGSDPEDGSEGDGSDDGEAGDEDGEDVGGGHGGGSGGSAGYDPVMGTMPEAMTDEAWEENQKTFANGDTNYVYLTLPKAKMENVYDDYKTVLEAWDAETKGYSTNWMATHTKNFTEWKMAEEKVISFMVKEFEMRKAADQYARTSIAKTGRIDPNKLYSYKFADDIFQRLAVEPGGKNHGFVMLLDWSGSMQPNLRYTLRQLFSLTMFCKRVQIPFEVYLFRNVRGHNHYNLSATESADCWDYNEFDMQMEDIKLRNILSSRMKATDLIKACTHLWAMAEGRGYYCEPMSGTPLMEAVTAMKPLIQKFRADNKVQICNTVILSDGDGFSSSRYCVGFSETGVPMFSQMIRSNEYGSNPKQSNFYVIRDEATRREYPLPKYFGSREIYNTLLEMMKADTDANLLGFFLSTNMFKEVSGKFLGGVALGDFIEKMQKKWSGDGFIEVTNLGFDTFYVINLKKVKSNKEVELEVNSDMTRGKIYQTFKKFNEKKAVNRVLLQSFITVVAGQMKRAKVG